MWAVWSALDAVTSEPIKVQKRWWVGAHIQDAVVAFVSLPKGMLPPGQAVEQQQPKGERVHAAALSGLPSRP